MSSYNKLDYIFVDLDGTIIEDKYRHYQCYLDIITSLGGTPISIEEYWDKKRRAVGRKYILEASQFLGEEKEFLELWLEKIEEISYLEKSVLKPQVKETLIKWTSYAENIVLVTLRRKKENLFHQLKSFGLLPFFHEVIACDPSSKYSKYDSLKKKEFSKAIFIGDTEIDVLTAEMLKIKCVGVTNGLRIKELLNTPLHSDEIHNINMEDILKKLY